MALQKSETDIDAYINTLSLSVAAAAMAQSPAIAGPVAWRELHEWAERFRDTIGDSCGCGDFAVTAARGLHDAVNLHLGKPALYPDDLLSTAKAFEQAVKDLAKQHHEHERKEWEAGDGYEDNTYNAGQEPSTPYIRVIDDRLTLAQAMMSRARPVAREQFNFEFVERPQPQAIITPFPASSKPTLTLFPFQKIGIDWLKQRETALLADQPGLGKTNQAIFWAADRKPVLVIVPAAILYNWRSEIAEKWQPGAEVTLLDRNESDSLPAKLSDWTVTTYSQLGRFMPQLKRAGFKSVMIDEAHLVKNLKALRTKLVLDLVAPVELGQGQKIIPSRLAITGTPILNRPPELFPLMVFLGKAERHDWQKFLDHYTVSEKTTPEGEPIFSGYRNLEELHNGLKTYTLRRFKKDVLTQLPDKIYRPIFTTITNAAEYNKAERDFVAWLLERGERTDFGTRALALVKMNNLRHLAAQGKVRPVANFLTPCQDADGHKVVVFSSFVDTLEDLSDEKGGFLYDGSTPKDERQEIVKQFQANAAECFFFGTIGAAGVGITLTAADRLVFVDLPWTPGAKEQAEDRIHRIGQKKSAEIIPFLAKGTIDERILTLLSDKEKVISQVVDGFAADRASIESVSTKLLESFLNQARANQGAPGMAQASFGQAKHYVDESVDEPEAEDMPR